MGGNAVVLACRELQAKALELASTYLDTEPDNLALINGAIYRKGEDESAPLMTLGEVAGLAQRPGEDNEEPTGLETTEYFETEELTYSYGSHVAHVAVDPETGKIDILRYVVVEDIDGPSTL